MPLRNGHRDTGRPSCPPCPGPKKPQGGPGWFGRPARRPSVVRGPPGTRPAGTETSIWYANHIEAVVCLEGEAELTDEESGEQYWIRPGTMHPRQPARVTPVLPRCQSRGACRPV
ncbi:ectoine synthase [Streptomyces sp. ISL-44]|uniref:ectoine synthase n=1 Tax=Streptomyces sp. ISL-44 TaxID=2819184 RepID=UPI0035ABF35C